MNRFRLKANILDRTIAYFSIDRENYKSARYIFTSTTEEQSSNIETESRSPDRNGELVNPRELANSNQQHDNDEHQFCQICGDMASGWHCG